MEYKIEKKDGKVEVAVSGRIDNNTTPQLEEAVTPEIDGVDELVFDFRDLQYISSAGLRLLLMIQKKMNANGKKFVITNVNDFVMEVFEITKFKDILTIV